MLLQFYSRIPEEKTPGICYIPSRNGFTVKKAQRIPMQQTSALSRASDRSQKKKSNFAGFLESNSRKNQPISRKFRGSFRGKLHQKAIGKKQQILWLFSRQISLEIDQFCADQTSIFNVFLTEVIICSFNNNTLQK